MTILYNPDHTPSEIIERFVEQNGMSWHEVVANANCDTTDLFELRPILNELYLQSVIHCKHYGTDIVVDILNICQEFRKYKDGYEVSVFYIGFRENGTDHKNFIETRLSNASCYGSYEENYKSMYKVIIDKEDECFVDNCFVGLYELRKD